MKTTKLGAGSRFVLTEAAWAAMLAKITSGQLKTGAGFVVVVLPDGTPDEQLAAVRKAVKA